MGYALAIAAVILFAVFLSFLYGEHDDDRR
jgi:hypothetical protein